MSKKEDDKRHEELKTAFHRLSLTDVTRQNPDVNLTDGNIILGHQGGESYVTRYRIDHVTQRNRATREVFDEECIPCTINENRHTAKSCLWNFIRSEAFLFSLHITALGIGVAKEALNVRDISEDLELVHSLIETIVAILMISIRMVICWKSYSELRQTAFACEHITMDGKALRGKALQVWRNIVVSVGCLMIIIAITCFILFKFLVHLGWTILSNNFAMIVFTVVSGLYTSRVNTQQAKIREDQHKTVIYEATLLISETLNEENHSTKTFRDKLIRFVKSVQETAFLEKPVHINVSQSTQLSGNMLVAMEMQSI